MKTVIAFDVDGTLSPHNEPVESSVVKKLSKLSNEYNVIFISGKNISYLSGLCRQLGIKNIYLSGENGSEYIYPATFPPQIHKNTYEVSNEDKITLSCIRKDLLSTFRGKIWEQPSHHMVSFFSCRDNQETISALEEYILENYSKKVSFDNGQGLPAYRHHDVVEILPSKNISKGHAVTMIAKDISAERIIVIGDGVNDISMMRIANYSIGIRMECATEKHFVVKNINEAFKVLEKIL